MSRVKRLSLCFYLFFQFISLQSYAAEMSYMADGLTEAQTEALNDSYAEDFVNDLNKAFYENDVAYSLNGVKVSDKCEIFMNKDQVLGSLGTYISNEIQNHPSSYQALLTSKSIAQVCPKYKNMSVKNKSFLWSLIMTTIAHFESSCTITSRAKGPNGTAYGYYQLHKNKEQNYDPKEVETCLQGSSTSGTLSSKCALSMINMQIEKSGQLFYKKSYWDVLRPRGQARRADDIQRAIAKSPLCKQNIM